jgi:four helix bundle protein
MQDFRNLGVWQRARKLTTTIYRMTADFPESEAFGLRSQMRRASVSICGNIAEGCGRRGDSEFRRFLDIAMGSACELECEVILSWDLEFVSEAAHERVVAVVVEIKRMISGLIGSLVCPPRRKAAVTGQRNRTQRGRSAEPQR